MGWDARHATLFAANKVACLAPFPRDFGVTAKGGGVLFAAADTFIGIRYHRRKGEGEDHYGNESGREVNLAR
jgi:hypothetical protein